jgi:DNA-binding NtrC family response regulator
LPHTTNPDRFLNGTMSQPTLLIIDDEDGVRQSLRLVFDKGYRVLEANSFASAMEKTEEEKPEVVLLDILMPRIDGLKTLQRIKEIHPQCQVIMLTALNAGRAVAAAMASGAFDYVVKPFDVSEIREKVNQALEKTRGKK